MDSYKFACAIAQFLDDKLGKDIKILNEDSHHWLAVSAIN